MARIYMVRHGKASASWAEAADPGLDDTGRAEAQAAADVLSKLTPMTILSSPLARARETAQPLELAWSNHARIEPGVAEVPSPDIALEGRGAWLRALMAGTWSAADPMRRAWRDKLVETLVRQPKDCVIFSHFVAINVGVGAATGDDRATLFQPANGSITIFETDGTRLSLIEKGREGESVVR
jgi:broad specificity phosphatase PhoE